MPCQLQIFTIQEDLNLQQHYNMNLKSCTHVTNPQDNFCAAIESFACLINVFMSSDVN
jgi:hypothetical protein